MTNGEALGALGFLLAAGGTIASVTMGFTKVASKLDAISDRLNEFRSDVKETLDKHGVHLDGHEVRITTLEVKEDGRERSGDDRRSGTERRLT